MSHNEQAHQPWIRKTNTTDISIYVRNSYNTFWRCRAFNGERAHLYRGSWMKTCANSQYRSGGRTSWIPNTWSSGKYLKNCQKCIFICSHYRKCFLATSSENPFYSCYSHTIYYVPCQPEWHLQIKTKEARGSDKIFLKNDQPMKNWGWEMQTRSGVLSIRPCSNATPKSMWTTSAVAWSIRIFIACLSPSPTM